MILLQDGTTFIRKCEALFHNSTTQLKFIGMQHTRKSLTWSLTKLVKVRAVLLCPGLEGQVGTQTLVITLGWRRCHGTVICGVKHYINSQNRFDQVLNGRYALNLLRSILMHYIFI